MWRDVVVFALIFQYPFFTMSLGFSRGFRFGLYGLAVFILAASMYALAKPSLSGGIPAVSEADHVKGASEASVTLVEYSDFQCPACKAFQPVLEDVLATYGDQVRLVYRHFPLYTIHPNAEAAAIASEAAANQGKFWEMHNLLFDRQADWETLPNPQDLFVAYAELLGLNTEQFRADLTNSATRDRVRLDVNSGNAANISATPTLYLNGTVLTFPRTESPLTYLKTQIDALLANQPQASSEAPTE